LRKTFLDTLDIIHLEFGHAVPEQRPKCGERMEDVRRTRSLRVVDADIFELEELKTTVLAKRHASRLIVDTPTGYTYPEPVSFWS
jgi:hypothetical protein